MDWWIWIVVGLGLLLVEMLTPGGFFTIFFGAGALAVGALAAAGLGDISAQLLVFSTLSIVSLLLFRKPLLNWIESRTKPSRAVDDLSRESAILTEDLPAGGTGQAELRGTVWSVENASHQALSRGQRCRVQRVDGLKLFVVPE